MPRYLFDAILAAPGLTCAQVKVLFAILRLTWGYYPDKNRDGARIRRKQLAKMTGLKQRTLDKVMPPLVDEGVIDQLEPPTGRSPAVLRVNPRPDTWGRFTPVECDAGRTLAVECDGRGTQGEQDPEDCDGNRTQSATAGVPRVRQEGHSTASPSPSSLRPSSSFPSSPQPPTTRAAEERVAGGFESDPSEEIGFKSLQHVTRKFMKRVDAEYGRTTYDDLLEEP